MFKYIATCFIVLIFASNASGQKKMDIATIKLNLDNQKNKADTNTIKLQIQLGSYYLNKQGDHKDVLDSAITAFNKAIEMSVIVHSAKWLNESMMLKGTAYLKQDNLKQGKAVFMEVIGYYRKMADRYQEGKTLARLGDNISIDNTAAVPDKINSYEQARALFQQTGHKLDEADMNKNIADIHLNQKKLDLAETELLQVLAQYKAIGYKKLHYTYHSLAELSKQKVDLHKELYYRHEVIKSMTASADTALADFYYAKLALVYADLDKYDQSLVYILKSAEILKHRKQYEDFYGYLSLIIYDFITAKRPKEALAYLKQAVIDVPPKILAQQVDMYEAFGNIYVALKDYPKAEEYYLKMMDVYKITNFSKDFYTTNEQMVTDFVHYNETMAGFYLLTRQFKKAGIYTQQILSLPSNKIRPITLTKIHRMQFRVDSASGNYVASIKHFEIHKRLDDSLFNAIKNKQIEELEITYKTKQNKQSIRFLQEQSKSQRNEIQKANMQRNITFGGVAMLIVIAGLAFNGYRHKQRSNQQLQLKQREINDQNLSLQKLLNEKDNLLDEKDWLLKEVHHRVKNNLQIVMSLLNTQSAFLKNNAALAAIRESQNRVQAIALIHQKLYSNSDVSYIDMSVYINELISYLADCYNPGDRGIRFEQIVQPVKLDVAQAVPVGLILNEAITNAIKYAFPMQRGEIKITLQLAEETIILTITDNGIGLPGDFDIQKASSLGMEMMKALSKQLGGYFKMENCGGAVITVEFRAEKQLNNIERKTFVAN
ncbi:Two-component sensor histidine kinase, contains HisKA and HATPase domains [Mucilaginibacter gossypiicola]|uniref:histidine kinase n=1 Tax=Mucilaginibacter gossypiicola TaxID=551995 RepID=A0A1H8J9K3_9SPHI|nr:sensor histidine kinase [Mucilaginibacter gossypiicola]SEN77271.1 Two-component sensor histidine kinase, contains HisKA and HATPase domains [Mucilaginibacter gossypiicola]